MDNMTIAQMILNLTKVAPHDDPASPDAKANVTLKDSPKLGIQSCVFH